MLKAEATKTWKLSSPIILGELTQMALAIIDAAMVGSINYKHLAAASLVNSVMNIPFILGVGITISVSQLVSTAHGRKNGFLVSHYLFNGFVLCTITAMLISLGLILGEKLLFNLKQDPEVARLAVPYFRIMSLSLIPSLIFFALKHFTDALEKTRTAMILSLLSLPINIILNWLLIYGNWGFPRLELIGAGLGTLITRFLMLISLVIIVLIHPIFRRYILIWKKQWFISKQTLLELLRIGLPVSLQLIMELSAFAISGIIIGTIGAIELAAHQIAISCALFTFMVSLGLAQGASIRISNAWGRNNWHAIRTIGKSTTISALIYGLLCALVFLVFREKTPDLFTKNTKVLSLSATLLLYAAVFQISNAIQATSASMLRGIKDVKMPTLYIAIAYWAIGIPVGYIMAFTVGLGVYGMWIGFIAGITFSAVILTIRFNKFVHKNNLGSNG